MRTIHKYVLADPGGHPPINLPMPLKAKILHTGVQGGIDICIWAEVDSNEPILGGRMFIVYGTGFDKVDGTYRGTVQMPPWVWHVYEL